MGAKLLQPSMTAGELAPALHGRVDLARYSTALKKCRNWIVRPYGGLENRPGFRFLSKAAPSAANRLIPFVYATDVSYVLLFGDKTIRFLSNGAPVAPATTAYSAGTTYALDQYVSSAGVVYRSLQAGNAGHDPASSPTWWVPDSGLQVTTPWAASDIGDIHYTQSADVLYLTHQDYAPREIRRIAANKFGVYTLQTKDGPFLDLNADESIVVSSSRSQGAVVITASSPIFTADQVGGVFYIEPQDLGEVKPWVVGDRGVTVGTLRRSEGKTYRASTVPSGGTWAETGNRTPVHESGRTWDGAGTTKTNGVDTWTVGVEWEFIDTGFGVVRITGFTSATEVTAEVTKRLPAAVVGGVSAPATTWNLTGDGTTKTFAIAAAGSGVFGVTIDGGSVQSDPYYEPPNPIGGGGRGSTGNEVPV